MIFGGNGSLGLAKKKTAKDFTPTELGRVKTMYSYRIVIWDKIDEMVRRGHSASAAVDLIEKAYCFQPVTKIIKSYRNDRKKGQVPSQLNPSPNSQ